MSTKAVRDVGTPFPFNVLGVQVNALETVNVTWEMERWIAKRDRCHFVACTGMHGLAEAQLDPSFKEVLNSADLVVADGMPLVWLARRHGFDLRRRVYGPRLLEKFCCNSGRFYRHYFYGGAPGVAERVSAYMERYNVHTVGAYSPPFRPLTEQEKVEVDHRIEDAEPDVLWVGLSTPKQERWMYEHRSRLSVPVMVGVGAAFDFFSGRVKQAPLWMQENGLECVYRLIQEPRRLWRRYLVLGPMFAWNVSLELLGLRKYE